VDFSDLTNVNLISCKLSLLTSSLVDTTKDFRSLFAKTTKQFYSTSDLYLNSPCLDTTFQFDKSAVSLWFEREVELVVDCFVQNFG